MAVKPEALFSSDADIADDGERWQSGRRRVQADMGVPDGLSSSSASSSHLLDAVTVGKDNFHSHLRKWAGMQRPCPDTLALNIDLEQG